MTEPHPDPEQAALHRDVHTAAGEVLLRTEDLTVKFGGLTALDSLTFDIRRGEILGLIGPNGAGKTTCFNAITGVYRPTSGTVLFDGAPLGTVKRHQITLRNRRRPVDKIEPLGYTFRPVPDKIRAVDEACREHQTEAATCGEKRVSTSHRASPFP